jgi:hypothetical protein
MSFWSALTGSDAVSSLNDANKKLKKTYGQVSTLYQPYRDIGGAGFATEAGSYGIGGPGARQAAVDAFQASPGYQFQLGEGLRAVQNSAAAQGNLGSGGTLRALMQYGQGLADQDYSNWQQGLSGLTQLGYGATQGTANARLGLGSQMASNLASQGAARTNAAGGLLAAGTNVLGSYLGARNQPVG